MKCSQCHASFNVQPPTGPLSSGEIDAGWDLDMPGAAPPPPAPPARGNNRYHIRRSSGKVFGPFLEQAIASMLEQGKLNGDEQLSLDGVGWMPMSQVPGLARFSSPAGATPISDDGFADLPAPKGAVLPPGPPGHSYGDMANLPAPVGAVPRPPAQPAQPADDNFGELDLDDVAELPAPVGAVPRPLTPAPPMDDGFADLPAPVGAMPPAAPAPSMTGMEYGQLDFGDDGIADLPAPKGSVSAGVTGLPAPVGAPPRVPPPPGPDLGFGGPDLGLAGPDLGITDLPAPKGSVSTGVSGLPTPVGGPLIPPAPGPDGGPGITGLPTPKDGAGVTGLPTPAGGGTDLQPKNDGFGNLDFGGGLDDLPVPAGRSVGLELDADFDLPVPVESAQPAGDGLSNMVAPVEGRSGPDGLTDNSDLLAPKDDGLIDDDDAVSTFEPPPRMEGGGEAPEPAYAELEPPDAGLEPPDAGIEPLERPSQLKKRLVMVVGALAGVILIGGITLGLVTDFGFFGLKLLSGELNKEKQAKSLIDGAKLLMQKDTFKGYSQAATDFEQAAAKVPEDPAPKALQGQALACLAVRFGPDLARRSQAKELATKITSSAEAAQDPPIKKLHGLLSLAFERPAEAITSLSAVSDGEPGDAQAAVYAGWAQLAAKQPQKASAAFNRAIAAAPGHAGAHFGAAQALFMTKATTPALAALQKALTATPNHPGSLILKARIEIKNNQRADAKKTLKLATTAGLAKASRSERGQAFSALGQLALLNGNNNEARKQFEQALKINPRDDEALQGLGDLLFASRVYSEALKYYQQARGLNPKQVAPALKVARTYIAMRKFTLAQRVLVETRKIAPQAPEIIFLLGLVEASANNLDAAEAHFNAAIKKKSTYFMPYLHLSRLHLKRNKPAEALAVLKAAGEQLSGSPLVRNAEGEVLLATKQLQSAQAKFEEALRLDPNLNKALYNLGVSFLRQGKLDKSQEKLDALKAKDREFPSLWEQLGALYVAQQEYAKADSAYDLALKGEAPSDALRLAASFGYNKAGKHEKSILQTAEVLKTNPAQAYARALRAKAYLLKGDKDEALIQIRQAAGREKTVYIMMIKGQVHESRGEKADAVDAYTDVLKLDAKRNDARFLRGRLLVSTGSTRDGIKTLKEVIKSDPNMAQAHLWLGLGYAETNKELKAMAAYKTAVAKDPKLAEAHYRLGLVLFDRRSWGPALAALKQAVLLGKEADRWLGDANYYLGEAAYMLKQKKIAAKAYYRFKQLDPNSALVREANKRLRAMGLPLKKPAAE